jgi:hypothetical protein
MIHWAWQKVKWRFIFNTVMKFVAPFGGEDLNNMRHY